jgi:hypothetical protein
MGGLLAGLPVKFYATLGSLHLLSQGDNTGLLLAAAVLSSITGLVAAHALFAPWWTTASIVSLLFGATLLIRVTIMLNTRIRWAGSGVPARSGWSVMAGILLYLMVSAWDVPLYSLELALVLGVTLLLTMPPQVILDRLALTGRRRLDPRGSGHSRNRGYLPILIFVASLLLAYAVFGTSIRTTWSGIDAHEITLLIGPGRTLSFRQLLQNCSATEVGQLGKFERFRPTYWFLRLSESLVCGPQPDNWHACQILLAAVGIAIGWRLLIPPLGYLTSGFLCAYALARMGALTKLFEGKRRYTTG